MEFAVKHNWTMAECSSRDLSSNSYHFLAQMLYHFVHLN